MKLAGSNCTLPPEGANFVSSPEVRGTLDILWSSLAVLLVCTWSILHLNVPVQSVPATKWQKYKRSTLRALSKSKWMLFNVAAPEWSLGKAWSDYCSVSSCMEEFKAFADKDGVKWTRMHSHFANLGGFAIRFTPSTRQPEETSSSPADSVAGNQRRRSNSGHNDVTDAAPAAGPLDVTSQSLLGQSCTLQNSASDTNPETPNLRGQNDRLDTVGDPKAGYELQQKYATPATAHRADQRRRQVLPNEIRRQYRLFERFRLSSAKIQSLVAAESQIIGSIDWILDKTNDAAVTFALGSLDLDYFQGEWEKRRFASVYRQMYNNLAVLRGDLWVLDAHQILLARKLGIIETLPDVDVDDLDDRNKGDILVKFIALGQILGYLIQLATRLARRINTSQLEILTLAFTASTAVTYLILLDKPKDVQYSIVLPAARYGRPEEITRVALYGPSPVIATRSGVWIPNNGIHADIRAKSFSHSIFCGACLSALLFGLVHCIAWEFTFPTTAEKILWQVSSVITVTAVPAGTMIIACFGVVLNKLCGVRVKEGQSELRILTAVQIGIDISVSCFLLIIFLGARIFIIIEVLRSLGFQPPETFLTTWSANIPHIG
ncbi:hypothetical protein GGI43DRAFT_394861 [Trichoderma evansii]